jgi:RNA polymerase sigma-70 factor (ECF subfamily)
MEPLLMSRSEREVVPLCVPGADAEPTDEVKTVSEPKLEAEASLPAETVPDALLARAAARGDDAACQELIRRYWDRIFAVAYDYVRNRDEAMDVTQETFLQMLEHLPRFRGHSSFYTWLHRIALNRCIDWSRGKTRRPPPLSLNGLIEEGWAEPADRRPAWRPDEALLAQELRVKLQAAIAAVPEPFRGVLLMADLEGLSNQEIAARISCPVNTVKTRLYRARLIVRRRLRAYLQEGG